MIKKRSYLIILMVFSTYILHGQISDFQTWYSVELKGGFLKKLDYSIAPEVRIWDNSSRVETILCEFSLSAPITKYLNLGVIYRPELKLLGEYPHKTNRFCLFGDVNFKVEKFRISYRGIYQQEYTDYNTSKDGHIPDIWHRHKLAVKYNIKKSNISPFVSSEVFISVKKFEDNREWKLRTSVGFQYKINKNMSCSLAYKYQKLYFIKNLIDIHILSFSLEYQL